MNFNKMLIQYLVFKSQYKATGLIFFFLIFFFLSELITNIIKSRGKRTSLSYFVSSAFVFLSSRAMEFWIFFRLLLHHLETTQSRFFDSFFSVSFIWSGRSGRSE